MITRRLLARSKPNHLTPLRRLTTTPRTRATASTGPTSSGTIPTTLLHRTTAYSRQLPTLSSLSSTRQWLRTLPIFIAVLTASALGIFNYQKVNSPVITATLYSLRTNPRVREVLGDEVYFGSRWAWIWGEINLVQGRIDVRFSVKGSKRAGLCRFKARRVGGRGGSFRTLEWSLVPEGGETMQLLEEMGDPMEGSSF